MEKGINLDTLLIGTKVFVCDGGHSKYLGEGAYLGCVRTFYFEYRNGITSNGIKNPEQMPTEEELVKAYKRGAVLKTYEKMPKIKLDFGKVIYGMDCWWTPINDEANFDEQKEKFITKMHKRGKEQLDYLALIRQYKKHEITLARFKSGLRKLSVPEKQFPAIIASAEGIRVTY